MPLTKTPLSMLESKGSPDSNVRYDGLQVVTDSENNDTDSGVASGTFDDVSGTLTLTLYNGGSVKITGFMTQGHIGTGDDGNQGLGGVNGADGLVGADGQQGPQGCPGPIGYKGSTGPRGPVGLVGPEGPAGPSGVRGDAGIDGKVDIYIQDADPGPVGAGAIWVKPTS